MRHLVLLILKEIIMAKAKTAPSKGKFQFPPAKGAVKPATPMKKGKC